MDRVRFIQYKDKTVLLEDFSGMRPCPEFFEALQAARQLIARQPPKSVLAVFDATGSVFNAQVLSALKTFVQANTPYIKCAAVVGISGLLKIGLTAVSQAAGRPYHLFATREAALDFLAEQA